MRNLRSLTLSPFVLAALVAGCGAQPTQERAADAAPAQTSPSAPASTPARIPAPADAQVGAQTGAQAGPAQAEANLRPSYRDCIAASGGTTPAMQDCIAEEYTHHDARLNAAYRSLRAALPAAEADALRTAQREWIKRRDGECAWDAATEGQAQRLAANDCMLRMTALRADELERLRSGDGARIASAAKAQAEYRADGAPDAEGVLRLDLGGAVVAIDAGTCREATSSLRHCTGGVDVNVSGGDAQRRLRVDALYLNTRTTAYRGPLDDVADRTGRSVVLADIDRDGREDLALWTGTRGANGAASYDVYLATAGGYRRDAALSALTEGANGLFTLENGQLVATSKSGCCIHSVARYELRGGTPVLVEEVVEDATGNRASPTITTRKLVDGRMRVVDP